MEHYFKLLEGMAQRIVLRYETESGEPLPVGGYVASGMAWATGGSPRLFDVDMREDSVVLTVPGLWAVGLPWQYCVMVREKNTEISWPVLTGEITVEPMPCGGGVAPGEIEAVACLSSETLDVTVTLGESTASCSVALEKAVIAAGEAEAYYKKMQELAINTRGPQGEPGPAGKDAEITKEALAAVLPVACTAEGVARADVSGVLVVGAGALARSGNQVIIGNAACGQTEASRAAVFGDGAQANYMSAEAVVVGAGAKATRAAQSVVVGTGAAADGMGSVALGRKSSAVGTADVVVGYGAKAETGGHARVAVGRDAVAFGNNAVCVGAQACAVGKNAVAVGSKAQSLFAHATALGEKAETKVNYSLLLKARHSEGSNFTLEMIAGRPTGMNGSIIDTDPFVEGAAIRLRIEDELTGRATTCTIEAKDLFKLLRTYGAGTSEDSVNTGYYY